MLNMMYEQEESREKLADPDLPGRLANKLACVLYNVSIALSAFVVSCTALYKCGDDDDYYYYHCYYYYIRQTCHPIKPRRHEVVLSDRS